MPRLLRLIALASRILCHIRIRRGSPCVFPNVAWTVYQRENQACSSISLFKANAYSNYYQGKIYQRFPDESAVETNDSPEYFRANPTANEASLTPQVLITVAIHFKEFSISAETMQAVRRTTPSYRSRWARKELRRSEKLALGSGYHSSYQSIRMTIHCSEFEMPRAIPDQGQGFSRLSKKEMFQQGITAKPLFCVQKLRWRPRTMYGHDHEMFIKDN
jgi:hypothetical protein